MDSEVMSTGAKSLPFMSPSSPPPIDPDYTLERDEDYDSFVDQDDSYDITGLSQKLTSTGPKNDTSSCTTDILNKDDLSAESIVSNASTDKGKCGNSDEKFNSFTSDMLDSRPASSTSESLSIGTPPPLDCVGSIHDINFIEESSYHNHSSEVDEDFGLYTAGPSEHEAAVNCIEVSLKASTDQQHSNVSDGDDFGDFVIGTDEVNIEETTHKISFDNLGQPISQNLVSAEECSHTKKSSSHQIIETNTSFNIVTEDSNDRFETGSPIRLCHNIGVVNDCIEHDCDNGIGKFDISVQANSLNEEKIGNLPDDQQTLSSDYTSHSPIKICSKDEDFNEIKVSRDLHSPEKNKEGSVKGVICDIGDEEDDSDYGDFADFETLKVDQVVRNDLNDDFADVSEEENSEMEKELRNKIDMAINDDEDDDDDDFGDFSSNVDFDTLKETAENELRWNQSEEKFARSTDNSGSLWKEAVDSKLHQFDALILKWVPLEPCFNEDSDSGKSLLKLDEVVDGDAFIWHHLEDIDSCLALKLIWPSTQSNKLFLTSLNVDARNIVSKDSMLFGNKWSSSVPLFAQTLSFLPLTPAKSSDVASSNSWSLEDRVSVSRKSSDNTSVNSWSIEDRGAASSKKPIPEDTEKPVIINKETKDAEIEGIIPPAQFDWSSSGLTNPLDTPGFEKEILSDSSQKVPARMWVNEKGNVPSPILEKIMQGNQLPNSHKTSLESLPQEVREIVNSLPDLNFMKSKVLMFPIRGLTET